MSPYYPLIPFKIIQMRREFRHRRPSVLGFGWNNHLIRSAGFARAEHVSPGSSILGTSEEANFKEDQIETRCVPHGQREMHG